MTTSTIGARPDGHGHILTIDGQGIKFDSVWGDDELMSIVIWTHDMTDGEILARARAYFEGPFAKTYGDYELDSDDWADITIRRVWARWRPPTDDDKKAADYYEDEDSGIRWYEQRTPDTGLRPACVVDID